MSTTPDTVPSIAPDTAPDAKPSATPNIAPTLERVTLSQVAAALDLWRKNKKSKSERIPQDVLELISQVIPKYSKSKILRTLRIHEDRYHKIKNSAAPAIEANHFVPFRLVTADTSSNQGPDIKCEIYSSSRARLVIHSRDVAPIIKAFMSCSN